MNFEDFPVLKNKLNPNKLKLNQELEVEFLEYLGLISEPIFQKKESKTLNRVFVSYLVKYNNELYRFDIGPSLSVEFAKYFKNITDVVGKKIKLKVVVNRIRRNKNDFQIIP